MPGFTLAEVLVTLVVLGIIAAITIPTLRGGLDSKKYRVPLKKAYTVLTTAFDNTMRISTLKRTSATLSNAKQLEFFNEFRKQLAISKICCVSGTDSSVLACHTGRTAVGDNKCFSSDVVDSSNTVMQYFGANGITNSQPNFSFSLKDGTSVSIIHTTIELASLGIDPILRRGLGDRYGTCVVTPETGSSTTTQNVLESSCTGTFTPNTNGTTNETFFIVFVDVNGLKAPNQAGKDVHAFVYTSSDSLIPTGVDRTSNAHVKGKWDFTAEYLDEE